MKKNKKTIVSAISALALLSNLFLPTAAWAYSFNVGPYQTSINVNDILREANYNSLSDLVNGAADDVSENIIQSTEERFGFTDDLWRAATRKMSAPRVEIFFDNTNPKPGEKVTAHAVPEFFKNDPQNIYYTWYIIHTKDGDIKTATNSIKEGKIEAAKDLARGDYDPNLDGQTYSDPSKDPDNDGWPNVDANSFSEDTVAAPMGGADGVGGLADSTVEAYDSASKYCDSLGGHTASDCSFHDDSTYLPLASYFTPFSTQANHYCNLCSNYFVEDGASSYASAETSRNDCCYAAIPQESLECSETDPITEETTYFKCPQDPGTDYCGTTYNSLFDGCYSTFKSANRSNMASCLDSKYDSCKADWKEVHQDYNDDGFSDFTGQATVGVSRCFRHNFGTNANASPYLENSNTDSTTNDPSGLDYSVSCKHKWANASEYTSGSGKFSTGEEKAWGTDPTDPDTDGDGSVDEADVIGLGQDSLTWNYQPGDRVGVVVEGTSMIPTDETSAYYKIMWGYMDVCDSTKSSLLDKDECDGSGDYGSGFLATESPNEQGDDKLKVSLSFSPDAPLADPSDDNAENISADGTISDADQITLTSSLDNTDNNPGNLFYSWQISTGNPQKDDWKEIKDIPGNFNTASPSAGMGLSTFSFTPKKSALSSNSGINYFKVTLTASKASDLTQGRARSSVIIPVNTQGVKIALHKVDIVGGKAVVGDEICTDGLYKTLCPVTRGQMLAAVASGSHYKSDNSEFSWKVDDNPVYPPSGASVLFDGWSNMSVFFPITKNEQEIESISVTATSKDELQPATGARLTTVVHPAVFIKSGDANLSWPKTYTAEAPNQKSTYQTFESPNAFEALTNSNPSYYLDFVPYYLIGEDANSQINWSVNGTDITSPDFFENNPYLGQISLENNDRTIKLPTGSVEGSFTDLSAEVKKYWSDDERSIPYTAWGIAPDTLSGDSSVSIETVSAPTEINNTSASAGSGQILAAIGTHLPHYFMYLLRLALTMAVMFVVSAGFYGVSQKLNFSDEE
jgi:hypothetical protein